MSSARAPETSTRAVDYALVNAVYGAATAALVFASRRRSDAEESFEIRELPLLAAATFALAEVVTHEKIATWLRQPFVEEDADHRPREPRGRGMRRVVGELVTCSRCAGTWSALALTSLRTASPRAGRIVTGLLATSAANDFLQGAFRLLTERADAAARK